MVLCMCQSCYSNGWTIFQHQRKISGPNAQLYFLVCGKGKAPWTGWNEMVCPSIPPSHWTSLHTKATFLQHSHLTGLPCPTRQATQSVQTHYFITARGGGGRWDKQGYQQFWQNEAEHSSWKHWTNYGQWVLLTVLAVIQKWELDTIKAIPSTWDAWVHYILWQLHLTLLALSICENLH